MSRADTRAVYRLWRFFTATEYTLDVPSSDGLFFCAFVLLKPFFSVKVGNLIKNLRKQLLFFDICVIIKQILIMRKYRSKQKED